MASDLNTPAVSLNSNIRSVSVTQSTSQGVADIPVEILREILQIACADHAERFRLKFALFWDDDLANPNITPNSLSSVCRLWDAVLADIPGFWKHVVVHLDRPHHLEIFRLALEHSRGTDIESVTVLRSTLSGEVEEVEERAAIKAVLGLLALQENQPRIRSLAVRTRWSGSLPRNTICPWKMLRVLKLESERASIIPLSALPFTVPDTAPRSFPLSLSILSLTGPMFVNLWRDRTGREAMRQKALLSFSVTCLRAEHGRTNPVIFQEFVKAAFAFANASMTNMVDIDLPVGYGDVAVSSTYGERLSFDRIPLVLIFRFIDAMWGRDRGPSTELGSCKFYRCGELSGTERAAHQANRGRRLKTLYAEIAEISHPTDLGVLLKRISAQEVHIIRCPGFTNSTLSGLFVNEGSSSMERTRTLQITGCENFSQDRLQTFLASRAGVKLDISGDTTVITWNKPAAEWWRFD